MHMCDKKRPPTFFKWLIPFLSPPPPARSGALGFLPDGHRSRRPSPLRVVVVLHFIASPDQPWLRGGAVRQRDVREAAPLPDGRGGEGERQSEVPSAAAHGRVVRGSPVLCTGRCVAGPLPLLTAMVACPSVGTSCLRLAVGMTSTRSISPVAYHRLHSTGFQGSFLCISWN
jgi:hypothetical protein